VSAGLSGGDQPLAGRVALVTGAGRGVGHAIAIGLARAGATVCGTRRTVTHPAFPAELGIDEQVADLAVDGEIEALVDAVLRRHGDISVLVHAAGLFAQGRLDEARLDDLDAQYRVNFRAPYLLTKLLLPALRATTGHVVFINSTTMGRAGLGQYAATKVGLRAFAETLRDEVNPDGVRVTTVTLGRTATDMQRAVHEAEGRAFDPSRLIQPEDVASTVVHALSLPPTAQISELWLLTQQKV
jgi:NAD(P)-dependent dehydrogenase (short-subunit alcohol dehydrogenase family)